MQQISCWRDCWLGTTWTRMLRLPGEMAYASRRSCCQSGRLLLLVGGVNIHVQVQVSLVIELKGWDWIYLFQRYCRLNANAAGNHICELSGVELMPETWGIDSAINGFAADIGYYRNDQILIVHTRLNDCKEAGGRKIFASVETLELEKQRRRISRLITEFLQ
ncbi:hypothetical protein BC830DRAFT_148153 [Chytriomyces sp. MP71]|nr:hypothetical protein BC830DRAFT_148153 [Chytriomyces sp. MP71]